MASRSPEAGPGPGNDGVDVADELDEDHQQQGQQDVGAVVGVDGPGRGGHPAIDQQTQQQDQKEKPQDLS